ncbi:MAG: hypothetical protein Ta2G_18080 [Termitinemataceae bacterium]|nr:MAG: hypothetical protein Ta2G_18080 [Termitinemataceae bacterium]
MIKDIVSIIINLVKPQFFIIPILSLFVISACVKKPISDQTIAKPLPPINERLIGTVWVGSEMWEDIPIASATGTYTFTDTQIFYKGWRIDSLYVTDFYDYVLDYTLKDNDIIEYHHGMYNIWRNTIQISNDGKTLIEKSYFPDDYLVILDGRDKFSNFYEYIRYPYSAELRDMDYTKDLQLEGSFWESKLSKSFASTEYEPHSFSGVTITFNTNTYTMKAWDDSIHNYPYKILEKHIILENYYYDEYEPPAYAIIQNNQMIVHRLYSPHADYYIMRQ